MHRHFSLARVAGHELVKALLDLNHSHESVSTGQDVPEVLGMVAAILANSNYRESKV